jgi:outer membrane lipoprotein SlyB
MPGCGTITASIAFDCNNPLQAGAEDNLYIMNREDWLNATIGVNVTNQQIVEAIALLAPATAFTYEGKNNSNVPKYELIKQTYAEVYNHEVNFKIFKVDAATKLELESLAKGSVVVIIENKFKGADGNAAFEIYGADAGLIVTQNIREILNTDTQGAFDLILKSDEASLEPHMPKTLFNTDYATTKAIVTSLL